MIRPLNELESIALHDELSRPDLIDSEWIAAENAMRQEDLARMAVIGWSCLMMALAIVGVGVAWVVWA
jgi:hypothetical protein